jgi:SAM-dependent methyltransferase
MSYNDVTRFESGHGHRKWSERARLGELQAVLYAGGSERENLLMHAQSMFGARIGLGLCRKRGTVVDFGCGTGRMLRFFAGKGWSVIGTEITGEMLSEARRLGLPDGCTLYLTNGVDIPLPDQSADMVWVSGVLKYALFDPRSKCRGGTEPDKPVKAAEDICADSSSAAFTPAYRSIAAEMYRILRPGGLVVSVEMWVDSSPEVFLADFEDVGFKTRRVRILRRYLGRLERLLQWREWHRLPPKLVLTAGECCAALRYLLDDPNRAGKGFRDYLFVWMKPNQSGSAKKA